MLIWAKHFKYTPPKNSMYIEIRWFCSRLSLWFFKGKPKWKPSKERTAARVYTTPAHRRQKHLVWQFQMVRKHGKNKHRQLKEKMEGRKTERRKISHSLWLLWPRTQPVQLLRRPGHLTPEVHAESWPKVIMWSFSSSLAPHCLVNHIWKTSHHATETTGTGENSLQCFRVSAATNIRFLLWAEPSLPLKSSP